MAAPALQRNPTMHGGNRFKLAVFGSNCSSGRAATLVPERWANSFEDNVRLAQLADRIGIECMVPIGRWKGYGGATNFESSTFETITWACGLLAATRRLTVFGTVHVPIFPPVLAAKQIVTADHIGQGRFGLNIVCGWNQDEFDMFGLDQDVHDDRYARGQEWWDIINRMWSEEAPFDFDRHLLPPARRHGPAAAVGRQPPDPDECRQLRRRAHVRRAQFRSPVRPAAFPRAARASASPRPRRRRRASATTVQVFTSGAVVCRPTQQARPTSISTISPSTMPITAPSTR